MAGCAHTDTPNISGTKPGSGALPVVIRRLNEQGSRNLPEDRIQRLELLRNDALDGRTMKTRTWIRAKSARAAPASIRLLGQRHRIAPFRLANRTGHKEYFVHPVSVAYAALQLNAACAYRAGTSVAADSQGTQATPRTLLHPCNCPCRPPKQNKGGRAFFLGRPER